MSHATKRSRALGAYTALATRKPAWLLVPALLLTVLSLWFASSRLTMNAQLEALLPQGTPEHHAREEAKRRVINRAPLVLMVSSSEPALNRALTKELAEQIASWSETRWVTRERDLSYFLDRRLLYLPAPALQALADQLEVRFDWERCARNPMCIALEDKPELPSVEQLRPYYHAFEDLAGAAAIDLTRAPTDAPEQQAPQLCSDDGRTCLVKVLMRGEPSSLAYATQIVREANALLEEVAPESAPDDLEMRVVGTYDDITTAQASAAKNLQETALLSLALIIAVVMLQFHGLRAFMLLFAPLMIGAAWAAGVVALVDPALNLMAAFSLAALSGMGVDYGIHLATKYGSLREEGMGVAAAASGTLRALGSSLPTAALTTGVGFMALMAGRFRGLSQMGWIAAVGVSSVVLAYLLLFPALVALFDRFWPERRALTRNLPWPSQELSRRGAMAVVVIGMSIAGLGAFVGQDLAFEYDYEKLHPDDGHPAVDWNRADQVMRGHAVVLMADSAAELEAAATALREESLDEGSDIGWVVSLGLFVPGDQAARLRQIERLRRLAERVLAKGHGELQQNVAAFLPLLQVEEPVSAQELPGWVPPLIGERNGELGKIGIAYMRLPMRDAREMEGLRDRLRGWSERFDGVRFFSISAILGEVTSGLREDAPLVLLWALVGIVLVVGLLGRSPLRVGLVVASLLVSACLTSGLMVLLGWKIHLYNLAALPLIFGIGIDSAIYVVWSFDRSRGRWSELATSSRAVVGCALTTMAGFGGMMIATNPGLRGFGQLAALGIGASMLVNLVWLPGMLRLVTGNVPRE